MATLLFRLGNVPEEEVDEVRRLLEQHGFDTFESRAGFWGLGVAAIWLHEKDDYQAARAVLDRYQQGLAERVREERDALAERGEVPTLWRRLRQHPVRMLLVALALAGVLTLTLLPFLGLIG